MTTQAPVLGGFFVAFRGEIAPSQRGHASQWGRGLVKTTLILEKSGGKWL